MKCQYMISRNWTCPNTKTVKELELGVKNRAGANLKINLCEKHSAEVRYKQQYWQEEK